MARTQTFTVQQVLSAIPGTGGIKALVAKNLECDRSTVGRYAKRYVTIQRALEDEDEGLTDLAEAKSVKLISAEYWPAIRFRLETKGKGRGYVQRIEQEHRGSKDAPMLVKYVNDWRPNNPALPAPGSADGEASGEAVQLASSGEAVAQDDAGHGDSGRESA